MQFRLSLTKTKWFAPFLYRSSTRLHSTLSTQESLRDLLRRSAQQVAVLTVAIPLSDSNDREKGAKRYHGATLSSFTSISMHPLPLIAFALRTPSRMVQYLRSHYRPDTPPRMIVNLLSSSQSAPAIHFSRPDLHPLPFDKTKYHMSEEGIPVLTGCVGALSCSLVARVPLDADALKIYGVKGAELDSSAPEQESELYLARVLRVESGGVEVQGGAVKDEKSTDTLPLVYYERGYRTISNLP